MSEVPLRVFVPFYAEVTRHLIVADEPYMVPPTIREIASGLSH
jgi:hypothetical protein